MQMYFSQGEQMVFLKVESLASEHSAQTNIPGWYMLMLDYHFSISRI